MPAKTNGNGKAPRLIDLDAARVARAEVAAEPVTVKFGGQTFTLPTELPVEFAEAAQDGDMGRAMASLFGEDYERFQAQTPSVNDLAALMEGAAAHYGLEVGESSASAAS